MVEKSFFFLRKNFQNVFEVSAFENVIFGGEILKMYFFKVEQF